jgi:5-methylcytosine-specific restriction endonuclease McrA
MHCKFCKKEILSFNSKTKYCSTECSFEGLKDDKKQAYLLGEYMGKHLQYRGWARELVESTQGKFCKECNVSEVYNGKPITLQVNHIDGDATHNTLSNVELLCPNCHSQTLTYGSKNNGNSTRTSRRKNFPEP